MNRIFPLRFEIFANLGLLLTGMESRRKPINRPMLAGELNLASRRIAVPVKNGHDHRPNGGILRTGLPSPHLDSIGLCGVIEKTSDALLRNCHRSFVGRLPIYRAK